MPLSDLQIGINLPSGASTPEFLNAALRRIAEDGFNTVELSLDMFPLIIGGEIKHEYVQWLQGCLAEWPLKYSGHIGRNVDLRSADTYEISKRVLALSIDICSSLSLSPLTLHFEEESKSKEIEERFYQDHVAMADYARDRDVLICMENIEVERVEPVARMVRALKHQNFGMTFDVGHAYLASRYFGFDFLESVRAARPQIRHLHLSGNTGVFEPLRITDRPVYDGLPMGYRMAFGRGDIHAPPLWGSIPYHDVFEILNDYDGIFLCEYYSDKFRPFGRTIQEDVRKAALQARKGA